MKSLPRKIEQQIDINIGALVRLYNAFVAYRYVGWLIMGGIITC